MESRCLAHRTRSSLPYQLRPAKPPPSWWLERRQREPFFVATSSVKARLKCRVELLLVSKFHKIYAYEYDCQRRLTTSNKFGMRNWGTCEIVMIDQRNDFSPDSESNRVHFYLDDYASSLLGGYTGGIRSARLRWGRKRFLLPRW